MNLSTKQYFQEAEAGLPAEAGGYALGQFNVSTADQMKAIDFESECDIIKT